ncbi:MAG: DUF4105 domain-containing protein [Pseudomonadota bacterium]
MWYLKALLRQGFFLSAIFLVLPVETHAAALPTLEQLAGNPYWHRLLRDTQPDDNRYQSDVSKPGFFLSPTGHQDALAELKADAQAFASAPDGNAEAACMLPARRAWLMAQRPDWAVAWPKPDCPDLDLWLNAIDAEQATLVFASDYLNNPSSMFGHTLLRIDARSQSDDTRLLAYAINYAAQTNTSNGLEFAVKGLTGGYPGQFSLLPYYEKVKEYNDWESRDLWEYELSLSPAEVHQMLLALWEWRGVSAPYYFLSRNCSYELLGLLEMARADLNMRMHFPVQAIPSDTLRVALQQPGLLKRVTWRAASGTRLALTLERNSAAVNRAVKTLLDTNAAIRLPANLLPGEQAQTLETAYDALYARYLAHEAPKESTPQHLRKLLAARSQVQAADQRPLPERPHADPASGHGTARWQVGLAHDGESQVLLGLRAAYHDWLDPQAGYREGAKIEFLSGTLAVNEHGKTHIEDATLVGIDSLASVNALKQPLSWSVRLGAERALADSNDGVRHTYSVLEGGAGLATRWQNALCHAQSHQQIRGGRSLDKGWEAGLGARLGCLMTLPSMAGQEVRWLIETRPMYRWPAQAMSQELRTGLQLGLNRDQALRIELRQEWREAALTTFSLSWLRYF